MSEFYDLRGARHERAASALAEQAERFGQHVSLRDLFIAQNHLLEELLAEAKRTNARLASISDSRSSVELKTSARGVDITAKAYADDIGEAGTAAAIEYGVLVREVKRQIEHNWEAGVYAITNGGAV